MSLLCVFVCVSQYFGAGVAFVLAGGSGGFRPLILVFYLALRSKGIDFPEASVVA